jgi:hypothetical protein
MEVPSSESSDFAVAKKSPLVIIASCGADRRADRGAGDSVIRCPVGPGELRGLRTMRQRSTGVVDANTNDCIPQGWLNGILQASNSHYSESEVTPQRASLLINTTKACVAADHSDCHSIQLSYQARKGNTHA